MPLNLKERFNKIKETGRLPSPKGTALAIIQLAEKDDAEIREIARLVQSDPAIAGYLLKFANAAYFGNVRKIASVQKAISILGLFRVRQLVLGVALINENRKGICQNFDYSMFWSQSLATAIAAQKVSAYVEASQEESFTCGLLAEVGRLALATLFPDEYSTLLQEDDQLPELEMMRLEREHFGMDHRQLTLALMEDWQLPQVYLQAVEHQDAPDLAEPPLGPRARALTHVVNFSIALGGICVADATTRWHLLPMLYHLGAQLGIVVEDMPNVVDGVIAAWQEWGAVLQVTTSALPSLLEIEANGPPVEAGNNHVGVRFPHHRLNVLVMSADGARLEALRHELADSDYTVADAAAISDALAVDEATAAQLVICDLSPEQPDFLALPKVLHQVRPLCPRYSLALIPHDQESILALAMESGFDDYIQIPWSRATFQARLLAAKRMLRLQQGIRIEREHSLKNAKDWASSNRRLLQDALTDPLTGLPNRRYGMDRLAQESAFAVSSGLPLCCLMIDIDHFKAVNDNRGHDVGDCVLRQLAEVVLKTVRKADVAFRYGGEEFLVLCPATPLDAAQLLAERIRLAVAAADFGLEPPYFHLTISIGMTAHNPDDTDKNAMVKRADEALYRAKCAGRNQVVVG